MYFGSFLSTTLKEDMLRKQKSSKSQNLPTFEKATFLPGAS